MFLRPLSFSLALLLTTAPVFAQTAPTPPAVTPTTTPRETIEGTLSQERTVIGIPPLATASVQTAPGLGPDILGRQTAEAISHRRVAMWGKSVQDRVNHGVRGLLTK